MVISNAAGCVHSMLTSCFGCWFATVIASLCSAAACKLSALLHVTCPLSSPLLAAHVILQAKLLDYRHLLLSLGPPASGPAQGPPSNTPFVMLYNIPDAKPLAVITNPSDVLLSVYFSQPALLLCSWTDSKPWQRFGDAALWMPSQLAKDHAQLEAVNSKQQWLKAARDALADWKPWCQVGIAYIVRQQQRAILAATASCNPCYCWCSFCVQRECMSYSQALLFFGALIFVHPYARMV